MTKYILIEHTLLLKPPYFLVSLIDKQGILSLKLKTHEQEKIIISFDSYLFFSKIDEGDALQTLSKLEKDSCLGHSFVEVKQSGLLDWFSNETYGVRNSEDIRHYMILTSDDLINVLSLDPPDIKELP